MEVVACHNFDRETVVLDGKHFVDCTLTDCVLEYSGGEMAFESTKFRRCQYVFYGAARRSVDFLQAVGLMSEEPVTGTWAEQTDQVH